MNRQPPQSSDDPDDPFQRVSPDDPNLSSTAPPNPDDMSPPPGTRHWTWYVLSGTEAVGMSSSWPITAALTNGVPGSVHAGYPSWDAAHAAYTQAYNANAIEVRRPDGRRVPRSRRRANTPATRQATPVAQPAPPATQPRPPPTPPATQPRPPPTPPATQPRPPLTPGASLSNPYVIGSSAPCTPHRPSIQHQHTPSGVNRSNPHCVASNSATPFPSGHPQHPFYIGSSPAPISPAPRPQSASQTPGSAARLRVIEEALSEASPRTPAPAHNTQESIRTRLSTVREALERLEREERQREERHSSRHTSVSSPQTPTQANSNTEARLAALEAAVDQLNAREAARSFLEGARRLTAHTASREIQDGRDPILDGHDPTPSHTPHPFLDGRDPTPPRSAPAIPIAGSSTGPGTIAGGAAYFTSAASGLRSPFAFSTAAAVACLDDDDEYAFDEYTPEENAKLEELLNAIHENYKANK